MSHPITGAFLKTAASLAQKVKGAKKAGKSKLTRKDTQELVRDAMGLSKTAKIYTPILPCGVTPGPLCDE